jgi:SAM-dependent methyltransferase
VARMTLAPCSCASNAALAPAPPPPMTGSKGMYDGRGRRRLSKPFEDHYAAVSADYAHFRPPYPAALFEWLATAAPGRSLAWDCGTGSGQAAVPLADYFDRVVATDASKAQIAAAAPHPRIEYRVSRAQDSALASGSVDLITVAQALQWFDLELFYGEVQRVLRTGGLLAVWSYGMLSIEGEEVDSLLRGFHRVMLAPYWPPERAHVESGYRDLPLPFPEVPTPAFAMTASWTLPRLLGYVRTWSATGRYMERNGIDPVVELAAKLATLWGVADEKRSVTWPLSFRVGSISPG